MIVLTVFLKLERLLTGSTNENSKDKQNSGSRNDPASLQTKACNPFYLDFVPIGRDFPRTDYL